MKNSRGFTLIELLAVIVIMGILMAIAIPSINLIIMDARKDIYVNSARTFINEAEKEVVNSTFEIDDPDTTYYIHIANLVDDTTNLGKSGFATWSDSYVVATMDLVNNKVNTNYYFNGSDMAKWKITLIGRDYLKKSDVYQDSSKKINFYPVGNRSKIVVYDKNGIKDTGQQPYVSISKEKANQCFNYRELSDTTISITGYKVVCGVNAIIPNAIEGKEVVTLDTNSFSRRGLTSVYIPNSVKKIEYGAFAQNSLTSVVIPDSVTRIEGNAFYKNYTISKLTLPMSLEAIGFSAFRYNALSDSVTDIVPNPKTTIGACAFCDNKPTRDNAFLYKRNTDGTNDYSTIIGYMGNLSEFSNNVFMIPASKEGVSLKTIGSSAFSSLVLNDWSVVIPDTVTRIDGSAFSGAGIKSVSLPSGLTYVGSYAFNNNRLESLNLPSKITTIGTCAFNNNKVKSGDILIYRRNEKGIDYSEILSYSGDVVENFTIPSSMNGVKLQRIFYGAFQNMRVNGTLTLPSQVQFGGALFYYAEITKIDNGDGELTDGLIWGRKTDGTIDKTKLYAYTRKDQETAIVPSHVLTIESMTFGHSSKLKKIINKTGKSFNWRNIASGNSEATFEFGTIKTNRGDIVVTKE